MAKALGQAGAKVALNYANNAQRAHEAFADFQAAGHQGALFQADVTDETQVQRMIAEITASLGPVDIMVLNATCDQPQKPIEEYDWAFYQRMLDFFIKSPVLLTKATVGHMKAQRWGRIINIGSEVVARGVPNFTAYVAAKGGQNGFHRSLAGELAPHGITVNMVLPGRIDTDRVRERVERFLRQRFPDLLSVRRAALQNDKMGADFILEFTHGQNRYVDVKVRKADATAVGKEANGYVLASVTSGDAATVYFDDEITGLTSLTPGARYYLSAASPGGRLIDSFSTGSLPYGAAVSRVSR
jgi:3-oxoacyl-[acyl-carrier protein] reductase